MKKKTASRGADCLVDERIMVRYSLLSLQQSGEPLFNSHLAQTSAPSLQHFSPPVASPHLPQRVLPATSACLSLQQSGAPLWNPQDSQEVPSVAQQVSLPLCCPQSPQKLTWVISCWLFVLEAFELVPLDGVLFWSPPHPTRSKLAKPMVVM